MSGLTEILLIIAIILGIVLLPRTLNRGPQRVSSAKTRPKMTGWLRLAVFISLLWPALGALYFKPWKSDWLLFLCVGIGPVCLMWGIGWVVWGFQGKR
jgi:hypothetical protein